MKLLICLVTTSTEEYPARKRVKKTGFPLGKRFNASHEGFNRALGGLQVSQWAGERPSTASLPRRVWSSRIWGPDTLFHSGSEKILIVGRGDQKSTPSDPNFPNLLFQKHKDATSESRVRGLQELVMSKLGTRQREQRQSCCRVLLELITYRGAGPWSYHSLGRSQISAAEQTVREMLIPDLPCSKQTWCGSDI